MSEVTFSDQGLSGPRVSDIEFLEQGHLGFPVSDITAGESVEKKEKAVAVKW